jgi:CHAD domain-containing protein
MIVLPKHKMTADEFLAWAETLPKEAGKFELWDGEVIVKHERWAQASEALLASLRSAPKSYQAAAKLHREFAALTAARPRQTSSPTPDEIHRLRVAARRLRVALRLFRRMLPSQDVVRLRTDLRWFARSLGDVRDLDVYTDNFRAYAQQMPPEQQQELGGYELYLRRERAEARSKLPAVFADARYAALFDATSAFLAKGPTAGAVRRWRSVSVRDGIEESVRRSIGRVRRLGNRLHSGRAGHSRA